MKKCNNPKCNKETSNPKYCSSSCAAKINNKLRAQKARELSNRICQRVGCNNLLKKSNLKFCGSECFQLNRKNKNIAKLLDGEFVDKELNFHSDSWARAFLVEYYKNICAECGITDTYNNKPILLEVDHIDGKASNNLIENLRFLCPNCHSQTDTYRAKNKGNSTRVNRYR